MAGRTVTVRALVWACVVAGAISGGCGTRRFTDTPRTASEQFLVSAAVDRAVYQLDFSPLEDRKTYIDMSLVDRVDQKFVEATVRHRAWMEGVLVVSSADEADYILEVRSGGVGIDRNDFLVGIPASAVPTPGGSLSLPETAVWKETTQAGATRISFVAYRRDDRRLFFASGPAYGFSNQDSWWIVGAGPFVNDNVMPAKTQANTSAVPDALHAPVPPDQDDADPGDNQGNDDRTGAGTRDGGDDNGVADTGDAGDRTPRDVLTDSPTATPSPPAAPAAETGEEADDQP